MIAEFSNLQSAEAVALGFSEIVAARSLTADGITVVAALPTAIYSLNERSKLKNDIRSAVALSLNCSEEDIIVTFDVELYRKLRNDCDADEIIKLAQKRN